MATQVLPLESSNFLEAFATFANAGTATNHCNMWVHTFNRIPVSERPCAILFESDECDTGTFSWMLEILPSNKTTNLSEFNPFGPKADSAEAVLVRPGCTFTAFDEDNGQGTRVTVNAPSGIRPPKYHPFGSKYNPFGNVRAKSIL